MAHSSNFKDPWGWSKLETYEQCPQRFKFRYINKLKEPDSPALKRGSIIHKAVENYLNGWNNELPKDIHKVWLPRLKDLKAKSPMTEAAWGVDKKWKPLPDWFHPDTWLRAKSDVYYLEEAELNLIDMKTGKFREPSSEQIELYAGTGFSFFPQVTAVNVSFWFLDQNVPPTKTVYTPSELKAVQKMFGKRSEKLYKEKAFEPKPSGLCRYCSFSRQKGGLCKY